MARITKEIKELIEAFNEYEYMAESAENGIIMTHAKLVALGMTEKQLKDRGIYPY